MAATSAIEKLLGEMFTMMDEDGDGKIDKAECVKVFCDTDTVIVRRALDCLCDFQNSFATMFSCHTCHTCHRTNKAVTHSASNSPFPA